MDRPGPVFIIEASEAQSLAKKANLTLPNLLPTLVKPAQALARTPISNFPVGVVAIGSSGRIFFGGNVEFPGLPLHHSIHAEQFLITNLILHSEPSLSHLAVSAAPCGHCRQFLQEIRHAPNIQILVTDEHNPLQNGRYNSHYEPLLQMLPRRFGPDDLLDKDVPLALEKHDNRLRFIENFCNCDDGLELEALDAANKSHAPYSECPSGVALLDCEGKVYKGAYMESAAYNPSLGPVQAAVVGYMVGGGGGYERIVKAVLVEKGDGLVKQEETARLFFKAVAPACEFAVVHCKSCKKNE